MSVAFHATDVRHYHHVVAALGATHRVRLMAPWEVNSITYRRLAPVLPSHLQELVRRRLIADVDGTALDDRLSLGASQFLPPIRGHFAWGRRLPELRKATNFLQARRVAKASQGVELLHAVEGLGHVALRTGAVRRVVTERRNLHQLALAEPISVHLEMPSRFAEEPLSSQLDYEYENSQAVIVYSQYAKRTMVEAGVDADRVRVIPLPVPENVLPPRSVEVVDPFLVAYVGRAVADKGLDVAVAATRALGPPYRLEVAGPISNDVLAWLRTWPHVRYLGILGKGELARLYRKASCLVMPSRESFGLAVFEAAALGTPVIVRNTTGAGEYLPPERCRIVSTRSVDDWAESIHRQVEAEPDADVRRLSGVSFSEVVDQLEALYRGIAS